MSLPFKKKNQLSWYKKKISSSVVFQRETIIIDTHYLPPKSNFSPIRLPELYHIYCPICWRWLSPFQVPCPSIILRQRLNSAGVGLCVFRETGRTIFQIYIVNTDGMMWLVFSVVTEGWQSHHWGWARDLTRDNKVLLISLSSLSCQKSQKIDIYSSKCHFKQWQMWSLFLS